MNSIKFPTNLNGRLHYQQLKNKQSQGNGGETKKGITFVIPFRALQDGLEPTTP